MSSLRGRLTASLLLALVVVFIVQWLVVTLSMRRITEDYVAARLTHDAENLLAAVALDAGGAPTLTGRRGDLLYDQPFSGHYYTLVMPGRTLRSRSLWDEQLPVAPVPAGEHRRFTITGPRAQPLLMLVMGYAKDGHPLTVAMAEDLSPVHAGMEDFRHRYLLLSMAALAALIVLQRWGIRYALRPLETIRLDLKRLASGASGHPADGAADEVRPLYQEIDRLLQLLSRRLKQSRTAIGNLAHGLKTPLTLLLRLGDDPALAAHPQIAERLTRETAAIRRLIDRELKRARLAGDGQPGNRFEPAVDLPALVQVLGRLYADRGLRIDCVPPTVAGPWPDAEDMTELLGNLGDNACKWARGRVRIAAEGGQAATLTVEDDGPGCPAEQLDRIAGRGVRLDEATEGHGLGLAIARDIVEHYGGELGFDPSPLGGLRVTVRLPSAPS